MSNQKYVQKGFNYVHKKLIYQFLFTIALTTISAIYFAENNIRISNKLVICYGGNNCQNFQIEVY